MKVGVREVDTRPQGPHGKVPAHQVDAEGKKSLGRWIYVTSQLQVSEKFSNTGDWLFFIFQRYTSVTLHLLH
jgi:hypothetical protein